MKQRRVFAGAIPPFFFVQAESLCCQRCAKILGPMREDLKCLVELQATDSRLAEIRSRLAAFPKKLADAEARVAAAAAALQQQKTALLISLKERKTYEMDVDQWKGKVKKYKDQLGEVRSNEAYKALQHEIQMAEEQVALAEDRLLERMVAGETYEAGVKAAEKSLAEIEAAAKTDRQRIDSEQNSAQQALGLAEAERARETAGVPQDLLEHYQRLATHYRGVALSEVVNETCTMCRVKIRPHVFQELRSSTCTELFHCETCARLLYVAEAPAPPAAAVASAAESSS